MVGSKLKKFAAENSFVVRSDLAYGNLRGYAACVYEGMGFKALTITTSFTDVQGMAALKQFISQRNLQKDFRIRSMEINAHNISVVFVDNPGTMKKIYSFIEWFMPLLGQYSATGCDICPACGGQISAGQWVMAGGRVYYVHDTCAARMGEDFKQEHEIKKANDTGSYPAGFFGAFLGSLLGSVVWAVVLTGGYIASVVGLLIAWLADKGYKMLHGKNGKGKIAALVISVIFGVAFGTFLSQYFEVWKLISNGELIGFTTADIPRIISATFANSEKYRNALLFDSILGLGFAALGSYGILKKTGEEVSPTRFALLPPVETRR